MKETFIIRTEWHTAISELKPTEQAIVFNNLFHYHSGNENLINLKNLGVKLVWSLIEPNLRRNIDDYDRRRDSSRENGKLGGRPLKNKELEENEKPNNLIEKPNETKKPNETLSVFVTDSVINNNTSTSTKFRKPEIGNLSNYFVSLGLDEFTAQAQARLYFDYYESNGWKVGKNPMKDWKAAARTWKSNMNKYSPSGNGARKKEFVA